MTRRDDLLSSLLRVSEIEKVEDNETVLEIAKIVRGMIERELESSCSYIEMSQGREPTTR